MPVWTDRYADFDNIMRDTLKAINHDWALFKIDGEAKYLGVYIGPCADDRAQWAAPAAKWYHLSQSLGDSHAAIQQHVSLYNTSAITCLTYVGQLFLLQNSCLLKKYTLYTTSSDRLLRRSQSLTFLV